MGDFWTRMLDGTMSTVPRWRGPENLEPDSAVEVLLPAAAADDARHVADAAGVAVGAVYLGAHAIVLRALTGDPDVATGVLCAGNAEPLPVRLAVDGRSWADLVARAAGVTDALARHRDLTIARLARSQGHVGPMFENVLDLSGDLPRLTSGLALWVGFHHAEDGLRLRAASSTLDGPYLDRLAGYYVRALRQCRTDPAAAAGAGTVLSSAEVAEQVIATAGPTRPLPDRRAHEFFEERVRLHPLRVALRAGEVSVTYQDLDDRANRIAHALADKGVGHEDVVAVVLGRDVDWVASVLGVFKAGAVYLPIEPDFPPDRMTAILNRSECVLVLSAPGANGNIDKALSISDGVDVASVVDILRTSGPVGKPEVQVAAEQLAYVYFTSGSTGEPKGAMCEHRGMLNHLLAKIEDLDIREGTVVAQTAPQCFDISLWQMLAPLLAGGTTVLVEQDAIVDTGRFLAVLESAGVEVAQVVPSYLEVLLTQLEQQGDPLPRLRCLSVTGEEVKRELVARWFAAMPGRTLVNAYGLTETSDDTNHNVMVEVPDREPVSLGPPVRNVHVYVVDDTLNPVPLGAPGEIVFSGVCVGRGYINDEPRTRAAYLSDPHRPGQRLYRSGDFGRWEPDGSLTFLGRRDSQVKVRGFRIEIGEVESHLLRVPGVRGAAVVVTGDADGNRSLVAFYLADELSAADLRAALGRTVSPYMVPDRWIRMSRMPVTRNGKTDRQALRTLAERELAEERVGATPATATERRLAAVWADVLGLPVEQIGRDAHFFDRGGTSLSAVRLLIRLDRRVSLRDLEKHPVLASLAILLDTREVPSDVG